jgi:hypothetical protein
MKMYEGRKSEAPDTLNLGTRLRGTVSFTLRRLLPDEKQPGTHWTGDQGGSAVVNGNILADN